jgi:hypothetical protein
VRASDPSLRLRLVAEDVYGRTWRTVGAIPVAVEAWTPVEVRLHELVSDDRSGTVAGPELHLIQLLSEGAAGSDAPPVVWFDDVEIF